MIILVNSKNKEAVVNLAKGKNIIFSSSLFHFGCNHTDFNIADKIRYPEWVKNNLGHILSASEPRYRAFLYLDRFSTFGKEQQMLDSEGHTTVYVQGIINR